MQAYQKAFLELAIESKALKFGEFKLKSGRVSPYFFNAGAFNSGRDLSILGACYASAIVESGIDCDTLFGPAYKGIPLAACTASALFERHGRNVPYCFNRKEAKSHGEGGKLVGAELSGNVVIIDDVITAGTAIRESLSLIEGINHAKAHAVLIGLDRQERGQTEQSAVEELEQLSGVKVLSIANLDNLLSFLKDEPSFKAAYDQVLIYANQYKV